MKKFTWLLCVLFALCFVACDSGAESDVTSLNKIDGDAVAGVSVTEALTSECPNGGVVINQGLDNNRNGKIDEDEITSTQTVCNGVDGYTDRIVKNIFCTGVLTEKSFVATATSPYAGQTKTMPQVIPTSYIYRVSVSASGDVQVYAAMVISESMEYGTSTWYAAKQTGAATGFVTLLVDMVWAVNGGHWEFSLDRTTLVTTLVYHDAANIEGGPITWTQPATDCTVSDFPL